MWKQSNAAACETLFLLEGTTIASRRVQREEHARGMIPSGEVHRYWNSFPEDNRVSLEGSIFDTWNRRISSEIRRARKEVLDRTRTALRNKYIYFKQLRTNNWYYISYAFEYFHSIEDFLLGMYLILNQLIFNVNFVKFV